MTREKIIERHRQLQSIEELQRKAIKAVCRSGLWTQEEIDLAMAKGEAWVKWIAAGTPDNAVH